jgi:K+-transporting ATPase ATPase C chain
MKTLWIALRISLVTLVLTGVIYPLAVTGAAQALFAQKANGSLVKDDTGKVVGSELLAQSFARPEYFQPRPSAAGNGYDAANSSGSNLGPTSAKLRTRVEGDLARLRSENPDAPGLVPGELVTASGSGLDPHVSPPAALWQVPRIARARHLEPARVREVVERLTEGRTLGLLGEPTVNVLSLNLALDKQFGQPAPLPAAPPAAAPEAVAPAAPAAPVGGGTQ